MSSKKEGEPWRENGRRHKDSTLDFSVLKRSVVSCRESAGSLTWIAVCVGTLKPLLIQRFNQAIASVASKFLHLSAFIILRRQELQSKIAMLAFLIWIFVTLSTANISFGWGDWPSDSS